MTENDGDDDDEEKPTVVNLSSNVEEKDKKKKKKKSKKNKKGLADFMENNTEETDFKKESGIEEISSSAPEVSTVVEQEAPLKVATAPSTNVVVVEDDSDLEDLESSTPVKSKPSILMKDNETSEKKSGVKFDESKNNIVPFLKHEKLKKDKHYKKPVVKFENDKMETPLKRQATPREPLDENINTANVVGSEKKEEAATKAAKKIQVNEEQIQKLKTSSVVM